MIRYPRCVVLALFAASLLTVSPSFAALAQEATPAADCPATTPEENAELAVLYLNEVVWGDQGVVRELLSPDVVYHWSYGVDSIGIDEFSAAYDILLTAFPDLEYHVDRVVVEGDQVAVTWTATGTHRGEWQAIAPTERAVAFTGAIVLRFACGMIAEGWGEADHLGLLRQLGTLDIPAAAPGTPAPSSLTAPAATPCPDDTPEANAAVARRWTEEVINEGNLDVLDELLAPGIVHHAGAFPDVQGIEAVKEALGRINATFPETLTVDMTVANGDLVAVRWSGTGTHEGPFFGIEPTGNEVTLTGINVYRLSCGRIVESWSEVNGLDLLRQIGWEPGAATPAA